MKNYPWLSPSKGNGFFLIAGPCVVENEDLCFEIAERVYTICKSYNIPYIFKASYRKANRTRIDSFTGIGDQVALEIIQKVGNKLKVPTLSDIHESQEADMAAQYVDVLQIPAFLCRQTDLLVAAAKTGKVVNVKKAQYLSASSMRFAVDKIRDSGNPNVLLTERGTMLGYSDLVVDFRGIPEMQSFGVPVVLDVTHSLQQPNQSSGVTGGRPELIGLIAKAGMASGVDGIFLETHPEPAKSKSDGANMLPLDKLEFLLDKLMKINNALR